MRFCRVRNTRFRLSALLAGRSWVRFLGNKRCGSRDSYGFVARGEVRGSTGLAMTCAAGRGAKNVNLSRRVALGEDGGYRI